MVVPAARGAGERYHGNLLNCDRCQDGGKSGTFRQAHTWCRQQGLSCGFISDTMAQGWVWTLLLLSYVTRAEFLPFSWPMVGGVISPTPE